MSVNKFKPHILVIPEDDANRQLANGFHLQIESRQIQMMQEAGGWLNVISVFQTSHVRAMRDNLQRHVVLLLDFDEDERRADTVKNEIPPDLQDRVFLLGVWSEPEAIGMPPSLRGLKRRSGNFCFSGARSMCDAHGSTPRWHIPHNPLHSPTRTNRGNTCPRSQ